ncbi:MAG: hypothetical protein KC609_06740, partial [Myxococcales bacterium]|nr:hypothetical protein [Myxococcales bacterium]
ATLTYDSTFCAIPADVLQRLEGEIEFGAYLEQTLSDRVFPEMVILEEGRDAEGYFADVTLRSAVVRLRLAEPRGQLLAIGGVTEGPLAYADPRKPKPKAKTAARNTKIAAIAEVGTPREKVLAELKSEVFYHWGSLADETSEHFYLLRPIDVLVLLTDAEDLIVSYQILSNQTGAAQMQRLIDEHAAS